MNIPTANFNGLIDREAYKSECGDSGTTYYDDCQCCSCKNKRECFHFYDAELRFFQFSDSRVNYEAFLAYIHSGFYYNIVLQVCTRPKNDVTLFFCIYKP